MKMVKVIYSTAIVTLFILKSIVFSQNPNNYDNPKTEFQFYESNLTLIQKFNSPFSEEELTASFDQEKVSGIGDVNNDGYDDWAIGLENAADFQTSQKIGMVYIYFGSANPSFEEEPDLIIRGENSGDSFGHSVSTAGDINNDGYDDVIVGAMYNDFSGSNTGRAYIYLGGNIMDESADIILNGKTAGENFGCSVSGMGDVNNDGFSDVIVGAYGNDTLGARTGRAYIFYGQVAMDDSADVILTGEGGSDSFGMSVSLAGDVNNDGFDDVVVGAFEYNVYRGRAYIYFGGNSMDEIADVVLTGESKYDWFGYSVSKGYDINGDNFDDVIIGAPHNDSTGDNAGKVYVFYGDAIMDDSADVSLYGENETDRFGMSVSSAGDVNSDGYHDILVGAHLNDANHHWAGRAYIYLGGEKGGNEPGVIINGDTSYTHLGRMVSSAGDINNDGYDDVIIGDDVSTLVKQITGKAQIYFGGIKMDDLPDVFMRGGETRAYFGYSVSSAGDVNRDGFDDFIIGAYGESSAGKAYLYFGGSSSLNVPALILSGDDSSARLGNSVASAGDVNNDGYDDVIVSGGNKTNIYLGNTFMDEIPDIQLCGGYHVASAGDVNNDGFDDVMISTNHYIGDGLYNSQVRIFFGGTNMDDSADLILSGESSFGSGIASAGDVNSDGYDDVIIGAYYANSNTVTGEAYIYYGGVEMDYRPDIILTGENSYDSFGCSVSSAGDVNNDGFDDVIVGAKESDASAERAGSAYIYFGGTTMKNTPDVIIRGEASVDLFGSSVSNAGDVNNDGFDDVIVGAFLNDMAGSQAGSAYIYYGGNSMDTTSDLIVHGEASSDYFGFSVSSAGDVNNDGFSEVLVGAYQNAALGYKMGRAYLYTLKPTGVAGNLSQNPNEYVLAQNYPNPFNPSTTIRYSIPSESEVSLSVYNVLGAKVHELFRGRSSAGNYEVNWNASNFTSGIYFLRMNAVSLQNSSSFTDVKKLILLK